MYKLYSIPGSCSTGITVLLKKLGQDVEIIKRNDVPDYISLVPTNQVPVLDDSGLLINEGAAIVLHLLEKHDSDMMPTDPSKKTEFLTWLMYNYATLHPAYSKMFTTKNSMEDGEAKSALMLALADKASTFWKIIDDRLEDRKYIVGDKPTIIDYLATIYTSWGNAFPDNQIVLGKNVERLVADISVLPEFQGAYTDENVEFKMAA